MLGCEFFINFTIKFRKKEKAVSDRKEEKSEAVPATEEKKEAVPDNDGKEGSEQ